MGLFLRGALPIYQPMAEVYKICDFLFARGGLLTSECVEQSYEELRLEEVIFLVDAINEPIVLEDVKEQVALLVLEV